MRRAFLLLTLVTLACSPAVSGQQQSPAAPCAPAAADVKSAYQRWLDEDVAYIITDQERRAFLLLSDDASRERFITAFWQRRDPNPATPENEYRDEHYRRIAFANQNFAFGCAAGWRTDRGRIYIKFGKPDQVRKTSQGEVWVYNYAAKQGTTGSLEIEFVSSPDGGDLRLKHPADEKQF
jgi:GWxTD domain-containing protein